MSTPENVSNQANSELRYLHGFGNEHFSEALPGALVWGQNSPQRAPYGLYAEQLSGTAFTEPRELNRRTWMYRLIPTAVHGKYSKIDNQKFLSAPISNHADPNRLRWDPLPSSSEEQDFISGIFTVAANGNVLSREGIAVHVYRANISMSKKYFANNDGEMLVVPQEGVLTIRTELGTLTASPGEVVLISRGIRFSVDLQGNSATGYICENYGSPFMLPELGPIGANGLAHARDFRHPVAAYEENIGEVTLIQKFGGNLWATTQDHSPLDVVAWHGSHGVFVYDLTLFNVMGTVGWDHPDPSIFTVLTSHSSKPGQANVDFCIFPPRWVVAEHTFRPPHFHRNVMSEFMGLITGVHDSKAEGFVPGGASLHNTFGAHGPDLETFELASAATLMPQYFSNSMAFMFETRLPLIVTEQAMNAAHRQPDYDSSWRGISSNFNPNSK